MNVLSKSMIDVPYAGSPPLWAAAANDRLGCVQLLLAAGAARDAPNDVQRTPLHAVCFVCVAAEATTATALLAAGANANARDRWGATPLILAAAAGCPQNIEVLLSHGVDKAASATAPHGTALDAAKRERPGLEPTTRTVSWRLPERPSVSMVDRSEIVSGRRRETDGCMQRSA